jgi:NAD(P)-dependent dehydrogenase (short-subunit alcohol dehydrogenase family)
MDATRSFLMTGASRGLGRVAAERLLHDHPDLHLVVTARGLQAGHLAADLAERSGNPHVSAMACDLASLASVRAAAAELEHSLDAGDLPPLRGFVGNAGLQMTSRSRATVDGFEMTFGVNVLAYSVLLRSLLDRFAPPFRIVLTTSDTHFGDFRHTLGMVPAPRWDAVERLAEPGAGPRPDSSQAGRTAYSTSKLAVIYLVHALARRVPPGVDVYSFNPGFVPGTGLARDAGPVARAAFRGVLPVLRLTPVAISVDTAGRFLAAAAAGPRPAESVAYLNRDKAEPSSPESYDEAREEALWEGAAKLCEIV